MRADATPLPSWPLSRLGEALDAVARRSGCEPADVTPKPPAGLHKIKKLDAWIESAAARLGLEAEHALFSYPEVENRLLEVAPALFRIHDDRFLVVVGRNRLLGPDYKIHKVRVRELRHVLCREIEGPAEAEVKRLLEDSGIRPRPRTIAIMTAQRLREKSITGCWLLRTPPGIGFGRVLRDSRLVRYMAMFVAAHAAELILWILAWWMVGLGAMRGRLDQGWLIGWILLLLTLVPFRVLTTWLQGLLSLVGGGLLKERLLHGALQLEPDEIRHQGAGHLLGRVFESEALETLALSGGFLALVAVVEMALATPILAIGAGGFIHVTLLVLWTAFVALLGWSYYRQAQRWTQQRLRMTHDLTERMVGHRTRLAQQSPDHWHDGEDAGTEHYLQCALQMDRRILWLTVAAPRGWLVAGVLGLCPAFVSGQSSPELVAAGLGGVLLAYRAFRSLSNGIWSLVGARISWEQVKPVFEAAERPVNHGNADFSRDHGSPEKHVLLEAHELSYQYSGRPEPVLRSCNMRVETGDRVILEGPSGGGKSTFVSLLSGMRRPSSGLLLLAGMDRTAVGTSGWHRFVAAAPQFHENYVLTGTFSFNLLMGRPGLLDSSDFAEAEEICRELGLDELIQRMPSGLWQMVGESGWQLSHGERSRLYIARALLQGGEAIVLDESFAALDPENLRSAVQCVLKRARTLIVVAHR